VTQKIWRDVVIWKQQHGGSTLNSDPGYYKGDNQPVENITWYDIITWIGYLNEKEGTTKYRLPTEAEWQFAAGGGIYSHNYIYSGSNDADDVGWVGSGDPTSIPAVVGLKQPNELGIYDMTGNIDEWCSDWFAEYPNEPLTNPKGPVSGSEKVLRGGWWGLVSGVCANNYRFYEFPDYPYVFVGFRLVRKQ
jgi:formylglycine-generating enzyme required for sulfatase activity